MGHNGHVVLLANNISYRPAQNDAPTPAEKIASIIMPFAIAAFALAATNASLQYHRFHNDTYAVALQDSTIEDENGKAKKNILRAGTTVRLLKNGSEGKIMVQTSDKTCEGWANSGHYMPV